MVHRITGTEVDIKLGGYATSADYHIKAPSISISEDITKKAGIIPWSKGGHTTDDNLQMLCKKCNSAKSDK